MNYATQIAHGAVAIIPQAQFTELLNTKKPLTIKLGADPTAPDLHIGHAIVLRVLRRFQDAGHRVIFLIGDFTARIGDPTGRSKTRPALTDEQITANSTTYFAQVGRILDTARIQIRYNSEWLGTLSSTEWIKICAQLTVARLIEREDFSARLNAHIPIGFHELLYPIMQGYDSVALQCDIEIGGTDQTFNLLVGRTLQEQFGQHPQVVMTFPLLKGLDGTHKMSKSQGNTIGLNEPAHEAFGKLMSISDELMWHYRELLLEESPDHISTLQQAVALGTQHPMVLKKEMSHRILCEFWSRDEADAARTSFETTFQAKDYKDAPEQTLSHMTGTSLWIGALLKELAPDRSASELRRLIVAGAVAIDEVKITDPNAQIPLREGMLIKIGKHHFIRLRFA